MFIYHFDWKALIFGGGPKLDEALLGMPFIKSIGYELQLNLERFGIVISVKYISEICEKADVISVEKYHGLTLEWTEDDPIELPPTLVSVFGIDT